MSARPFDLPPTFWQLVELRVASTPDAEFLEDDQGAALTFAGYRDAVERVAAGLLARGIGKDTVVAWQFPTTIDAAVLMAALSRVGAVQVPIIPILREREVTYITRESSCEWMIVPSQWRGFDFAAMAGGVAAEVGFEVLAVDSLPDGDPSTLPAPLTAEEQVTPRWLYYTSGSTADPKGVWHRDSSAMASSNAWMVGFKPTADDLFPIVVPFTHIAGIAITTVSMRTGLRLQLIAAFDPQHSPGVMAARGASIIGPALPIFQSCMAAQRAYGSERLFPRMRVGISGGAPKPPGLHQELREVLGGVGVMSSYGLTEFPVATCHRFGDTDEQFDLTEGVAGPGVEVRVVGADGADVPAGEEGEVRLRGPQLFAGYANPALDAAAFDESGFFRTGDLGRVSASGHLAITGRLKDIIIRNAENISAAEVEKCLHLHPAIADVAVVGLPDPRTGERACAVVKLADGHDSIDLAELAEFCRSQGLAMYKCPEQLEIVAELPRSGHMGKVEKQVLRQRYTG